MDAAEETLKCLRLGYTVLFFTMLATSVAAAGLRVPPYLQNPSADAISVIWFSDNDTPGELRITDGETEQVLASSPLQANALLYHPQEFENLHPDSPADAPWKHRVRINRLVPARQYLLQLTQSGTSVSRTFRMPPPADAAIRFVVYADCETEPESTGKRAVWPLPQGSEDRRYPVDQTEGYRANLKLMMARNPHFIAIAGDLVESGGEQLDWDEFWHHNAGEAPFPAAVVPIFPAVGNHDIFAGPGPLGGYDKSSHAIAKFKTYFEFPEDPAIPDTHKGHYYRVNIGPVALITLDSNNGRPENSDQDSNHYLQAAEDVPPDFNPGSAQYSWLEQQLADAASKSVFTFVQFHHTPYSEGPHGLPPGAPPSEDKLSGFPLRILTPLFAKYDVAAVFSGHCEMYEHSVVDGIHFFDVGIGGDGLRSPHARETDPQETVQNPTNHHQVFLAHKDAPETWQGNRLLSGGKHYGHIEVNVFSDDNNRWRATLTPAYAFPVMNANGDVTGWERRTYEDEIILEQATASTAAPQWQIVSPQKPRPKEQRTPPSARTQSFGYVALTFVAITLSTVAVAILRRIH